MFKVKLTCRAGFLAEGKAQPEPGEQPEAVVTYSFRATAMAGGELARDLEPMLIDRGATLKSGAAPLDALERGKRSSLRQAGDVGRSFAV